MRLPTWEDDSSGRRRGERATGRVGPRSVRGRRSASAATGAEQRIEGRIVAAGGPSEPRPPLPDPSRRPVFLVHRARGAGARAAWYSVFSAPQHSHPLAAPPFEQDVSTSILRVGPLRPGG